MILHYYDKYKILILLLLLNSMNLVKAEGYSTYRYQKIQYANHFNSSLLTDYKDIVQHSIELSKKNKLKILASSTLFYLYAPDLDRYIDSKILANTNTLEYKIGKRISSFANIYGENNYRVFYLYSGISGFLYVNGMMFNNQKHLDVANLISKSFIISLTVSGGMKFLFGRSRPYMNKGPNEFN